MTNANDMVYPQSLSSKGPFGGLTKREYFARAAMQGLLANPDLNTDFEGYAREAVMYADALIYALNDEATGGNV